MLYIPAKDQSDPNVINMVPAEPAMIASGIQKDSLHDPWSELRVYKGRYGTIKVVDQIGRRFLASQMIIPEELYAASFTPKGAFLTWISRKFAFKNGWNFVKKKGEKDPIDGKQLDMLVDTHIDFDLKKKLILATQVAGIFGRSLGFRWFSGGKGKAKKLTWRISPIHEAEIDYDEDTGEVIKFRPWLKVGKTYAHFEIDPKDAIVYVNDPDPHGNELDGISSLISPYRTIVREENIAESYTKTVTQRGLGILDVTVKGAKTEADLRPWQQKYGNPSQFSAMFHNERLEINTSEGMKTGYDFDSILGRFTKSFSSATGYPSSRTEGVQTGAVTGSETDQDNTAENYAVVQELFEDAFIETYKLLNPDIDFDFALDFPLDVKLDKGKKSQIFNQNIQSIVTLPEIITLNQAMEMLELTTIDGEEGDQTVFEAMRRIRGEINEEVADEFPGEEEEPETPENLQGMEPVKGNIELARTRNILKDSDEVDEVTLTKEDFARVLIRSIDSDSGENIFGGIRVLNKILKDIYGSGMSNNRWVKFRKEELSNE